MAGVASDNSTRPERLVETGSGMVSAVHDQCMDDSDPPPACPLPESLENETPESDYCSRLLVSRRRGGTRGRGGGARASRVTQGVVVVPSPEANKYRGATLRSLRGGRSFVRSEQQASSSDITPVVVVAV